MKTLLLFFGITMISFVSHAQVTKVSLQASGLTCSMCSNSINKALKTLSFVDNVDPNIETSTFEITFKTGNSVDFDAIKQKVEKAGFAVASFIATIDFKDVPVTPNKIITVGDKQFYFVHVKDQSPGGLMQVKLLNKGYVPGKEFKKNAPSMPIIDKGVYYATI